MQLYLSRYWFRSLLFVAYVLVVGCSKSDMPFPRCISADYFGPEPTTVGARFTSDQKEKFTSNEGGSEGFIDRETGEINYGFHPNQVVRWEDTGLEVSGDDLVVRVRGAWTAWQKRNAKESKQSNLDLQKLEQLRYATRFEGMSGEKSLADFDSICSNYKTTEEEISGSPNIKCPASCKCLDEVNRSSDNAPCWFTNGYGVYLLFVEKGSDPNETLEHMRYPVSPSVHLGYDSITEQGDGVFTLSRDEGKIKNRECNSIKLEDLKNHRIYIKILDRYYFDNVGGYSLEFLSGVKKPSGGTIFDYIYYYLKCTLLIHNEKSCAIYDGNKSGNEKNLAAAQEMFINIAEKSTSFHNFVVSLLVLFVVISSLLYLFGMVKETKHDLLIRMIKITLVVMLISPGSFNFFYNHFLILFVDGLEYLITIVTNFTGNSGTSTLFSFMENMFNKFFAYSVWKKFAAFFHYQMWASIIMVPAILTGIIIYFLLCVYAFIMFISGFIGIAFLVAIMPLFLISILFSQLKSLFEGWIKFCISFCLKSVMIFTLLSLLGAMVMNTFYRQLGFTVCYNKWLEIRLCAPQWVFGGFCIIDKDYFSWTPGQIFVPYTIGEASLLKLDRDIEGIESVSRKGGTVKFTGGAGYIPIPPDYTKRGFRYVDYPFFDPMSGSDHYIAETDIIVNDECDKKDLVRLANSLLHTESKFDTKSLIQTIDSVISKLCKKGDKNCESYWKAIDEYKNGKSNSIKGHIKTFVKEFISKSGSCQIMELEKFKEKYKEKYKEEYYENKDYQRVKDIKEGYLLNAKEIFILFLLSFLMFSLVKFAQEAGTNLAGGGYSVYTISSMYQMHQGGGRYQSGGILSKIPIPFIGGNLAQIPSIITNQIGGKLENLGKLVRGVPNRLAEETAGLLEKVPKVGGILKYTIEAPRKLVNIGIEGTKFITSPENDVYKFEDKIFDIFKVKTEDGKPINTRDFAHRKFDRYLEYYKGYVGSHLGYTLKDAVEFTWEHGRNSLRKDKKIQMYKGEIDHKDDLLYMAKLYRKDFLDKLYDYTIGHKAKPGEGKVEQSSESFTRENKKLKKNKSQRKTDDLLTGKKRIKTNEDKGVISPSSLVDENSPSEESIIKKEKDDDDQ